MKYFRYLVLAAVAVGSYVLGAKAGRGRYRDIRSKTKRAWNKPVTRAARKKAGKYAKKRLKG